MNIVTEYLLIVLVCRLPIAHSQAKQYFDLCSDKTDKLPVYNRVFLLFYINTYSTTDDSGSYTCQCSITTPNWVRFAKHELLQDMQCGGNSMENVNCHTFSEMYRNHNKIVNIGYVAAERRSIKGMIYLKLYSKFLYWNDREREQIQIVCNTSFYDEIPVGNQITLNDTNGRIRENQLENYLIDHLTQPFQLCADISTTFHLSMGDILSLRFDSDAASRDVSECRCTLETEQPITFKRDKLIFKEYCRRYKSWGSTTTCGLDEPNAYREHISVNNEEEWTLRIIESSRYYGSYRNTVKGLIFLHYVADQDDDLVEVTMTCETFTSARKPPREETETSSNHDHRNPNVGKDGDKQNIISGNSRPPPKGNNEVVTSNRESSNITKHKHSKETEIAAMVLIFLLVIILIISASWVIMIFKSRKRKRLASSRVRRTTNGNSRGRLRRPIYEAPRYATHDEMEMHDVHGTIATVGTRPTRDETVMNNSQPVYSQVNKRDQQMNETYANVGSAADRTIFEHVENEYFEDCSKLRRPGKDDVEYFEDCSKLRRPVREDEDYFEDCSQFRRPDLPKRPDILHDVV